MASSRFRRVAKELAEIEKDPSCQVSAKPFGESSDLTHILARVPGPPGTPYADGKYDVDVQIPNEYPFRPPQMKFITRVWHPNVSSQTGAICLDTLSQAWSPVLTIKSTLMSLQSLFESPEPKDPQDAEVARQLMTDPDGFNTKAHEWAVQHAGAPYNPKYKPGSRTAGTTATTASVPLSSGFIDPYYGGGAGAGAGDPSSIYDQAPGSRPQGRSMTTQERVRAATYRGYNRDLVERFVNMGFDTERVVDAFEFVGIAHNGGQDYELEEAYMGDITARLLGEP